MLPAETDGIFHFRSVKPYLLKKMKIHYAFKRKPDHWDDQLAFCARNSAIRFTRDWTLVTCQACLEKREKILLGIDRAGWEAKMLLARIRYRAMFQARWKATRILEQSSLLDVTPATGEFYEPFIERLETAVREHEKEEHEKFMADESRFLVVDEHGDEDRVDLDTFHGFWLGPEEVRGIIKKGTVELSSVGVHDYSVDYAMSREEYVRMLKEFIKQLRKEITMLTLSGR